MTTNSEQTIYKHIGGAQTIRKLVNSFYAKVAKDPLLSPIFPEDLTETKEKQYQFLSQYFGGPPLYTSEHGHPMLRARHMRFPISPSRAKAWLACMHETLVELDIPESCKQEMFQRLTFTAQHMVNRSENEE